MVHVIFSSSEQQLMACWRQKIMLAHTHKKETSTKPNQKKTTQKNLLIFNLYKKPLKTEKPYFFGYEKIGLIFR